MSSTPCPYRVPTVPRTRLQPTVPLCPTPFREGHSRAQVRGSNSNSKPWGTVGPAAHGSFKGWPQVEGSATPENARDDDH